MTPGIHGDPGAALLEVKRLGKFGTHIFNFKICASAKVSMIISNKYIFIRYSIRNKTQPLLIITLEFPSTLARLANILWLRAKLCITLVSLPPKKIMTKPKTKVLFIATANDLKTVSRWILWNIIDNSLQGKPFEPNWCFFQGLWGIEWRSYLSLVTVWRTNSR